MENKFKRFNCEKKECVFNKDKKCTLFDEETVVINCQKYRGDAS